MSGPATSSATIHCARTSGSVLVARKNVSTARIKKNAIDRGGLFERPMGLCARENYFACLRFSLYIRGLPHHARARACCAACGGFLCHPDYEVLDAVCFSK